ncbi:G1 family glutamic endopeptidase [Kitasatospora sp. NPDC047058]|uniref:G1 family glutamic endopeptidase n=1 Tax=Kitasatospora sp. NPDC047058 TaxID=3155620 RepID=UPI0033CA1B50
MPAQRLLALAASVAVIAVLGGATPAPAVPGRPAVSPVPGPPPTRPTGALATHQRFAEHDSANWAGYMASGDPGAFTRVQARWTQPAVTCTGTERQSSSFWVGLSDPGVIEQTGTTAICENGRPRYDVWYEMYPALPVEYNDPLEPGDELFARVEYLGGNSYELTLRNLTKKWAEVSYAEPPAGTVPMRTRAEVIAEAPGKPDGSQWPLADFGTVSFTRARVNGAPLGTFSPDEFIMVTADDHDKAAPSELSDDGTAFDVTWKHS